MGIKNIISEADNLLKKILGIVRSKDFILIVCSSLVAFFLSHVIYMLEEELFLSVKFNDEFIIFYLFVGMFSAAFTGFTFLSIRNDITFLKRQLLMASVSFLGHRLFYGVERAGTLFFNLMFVGAWLVLARYIFTNKKVTE